MDLRSASSHFGISKWKSNGLQFTARLATAFADVYQWKKVYPVWSSEQIELKTRQRRAIYLLNCFFPSPARLTLGRISEALGGSAGGSLSAFGVLAAYSAWSSLCLALSLSLYAQIRHGNLLTVSDTLLSSRFVNQFVSRGSSVDRMLEIVWDRCGDCRGDCSWRLAAADCLLPADTVRLRNLPVNVRWRDRLVKRTSVRNVFRKKF